jgi:hypothetical protein
LSFYPELKEARTSVVNPKYSSYDITGTAHSSCHSNRFASTAHFLSCHRRKVKDLSLATTEYRRISVNRIGTTVSCDYCDIHGSTSRHHKGVSHIRPILYRNIARMHVHARTNTGVSIGPSPSVMRCEKYSVHAQAGPPRALARRLRACMHGILQRNSSAPATIAQKSLRATLLRCG